MDNGIAEHRAQWGVVRRCASDMEEILHTISEAEAALRIISGSNTVSEDEGRALHGLANTIAGALKQAEALRQQIIDQTQQETRTVAAA
jgi:uncharacterized membrane protein YebE (DUF533 family)